MAISITDYLKVDKEKFDHTGAFDCILNVDSKFFIDPHLLMTCEVSEFEKSYQKVKKRFEDILRVLKHSKTVGDVFWNRAESFFKFPEVKGLCIGYSNKSTQGSAIGPLLRQNLLATAKSIIDAGTTEPEIFELVGLLEKNIGPDRISDIVANIIIEDILRYSSNIFESLGVETTRLISGDQTYHSVRNPHNNVPVLLVPKVILRDLPIAFEWSDIDRVCSHNSELRDKVNNIIGDTWKQATSQKKEVLKSVVLEEPELLKDLITLYKNKPASIYNFVTDRSGQIVWYSASKKYTGEFPLKDVPEVKTPTDLVSFIKKICKKYKDLVENNALSSLLYENKYKPKREEAAQKLFFGIADAYCEANNIDISREVNGGRGPVDFKFSKGYANRVVVESKLTTNNQLLHGFETQIKEYQKAEKTTEGIYLIIDVVGGSVKRLNDLYSLVAKFKQDGLRMPEIYYIDAKPKASASVYNSNDAS